MCTFYIRLYFNYFLFLRIVRSSCSFSLIHSHCCSLVRPFVSFVLPAHSVPHVHLFVLFACSSCSLNKLTSVAHHVIIHVNVALRSLYTSVSCHLSQNPYTHTFCCKLCQICPPSTVTSCSGNCCLCIKPA